MLHHGGKTRACEHRRAEATETKAAAASSLHKTQTSRSSQEPPRCVCAQVQPVRDLVHGKRPRLQEIEQLQSHAGKKHLGIDESRT